MSEVINLNNSNPAAPAGATNIAWLKGATTGIDPATGLPVYPVSASLPDFTGDSGSGGAAGLVPAPAAGDAAAGKFLKADGSFEAPPAPVTGLTIGFVIAACVVASDIGPMLVAPRAGTFSKCVIVTKASDPSTPLTIQILQNGRDVFSGDPTVAAGTASGTVTTSTALTSTPLTVAAGDVFSINVTSGTAAWVFTAQLET